MVSLWQSDIAHCFLLMGVKLCVFRAQPSSSTLQYAGIVSHSQFQQQIPNAKATPLSRDFVLAILVRF
jgi:hypothetical protein